MRLTGEEWFTAIDFLERVGDTTNPTRHEFVLQPGARCAGVDPGDGLPDRLDVAGEGGQREVDRGHPEYPRWRVPLGYRHLRYCAAPDSR
ncbi:dioxygenase [Nocardia sp. NPDC050412]|uniref:dioxygenase n=1 Tax=Nocardia sp. NPDC050412 TaxID=3364320 RepID=UPI0037B51A01